MIYINPVGGFGNILFHIASIWTLAKDNGDDLCLLNIDNKINILLGYSFNTAPKYRYIFNRFSNLNGDVNNKLHYPFQYVSLEYKREHEYIGFFQCEKYFRHRKKEILELFKPIDEFNIEINKYSYLFNNISLHVRRTDRVNSPIYDVVKLNYYKKSLSILPEDMLVVIFSDDLKWCKENFIGERFVFIDEKDYIVIYLMSKMKHNIISNSTFSWWGAWLSEHQDKMVIAPKIWFGNDISSKDIVPDNWIKI
jgi:hypothetical protein